MLRGIKNALSLKQTESTQPLFKDSLSYEETIESDNESSENERSSLSDESYYSKNKKDRSIRPQSAEHRDEDVEKCSCYLN